MVKILNRRFIILQIIVVILISSISIPSVNCTRANSYTLKTYYNNNFFEKSKENINIDLPAEDADLLLERFYEIEQNYVGAGKIKKQIETLKEIDILSDDDFLSSFLKVIEWFDTSCCQKFQKNGVFIGPTVISHFIPGGSIIGTSFNRSWYYENYTKNLTGFLNGTIFDGVIGALPIYIGISLKPVFITAVSRGCSGFYSKVFFPFFELMLPCVGFSVRIMSNDKAESSKIFFEYNLDFCLFGVLMGVTF